MAINGGSTPRTSPSGMREVRPGVWELRVYAGLLPDGRQRQVSKTFRGSRREAVKARAALLVELAETKGPYGAPGTFTDLAERWYAHGLPGWKSRTAYGYRRHLDQILIPAFGDLYVDRIKPSHVDRLWTNLANGKATGRKASPATVERIAATLKACLNHGVTRGELMGNVVRAARPPRSHRREINPPSAAEITTLLIAAKHQDADFGMLCWLAVATGARQGELCALRWSDVDLEARQVRIARTMAELHSRVAEEPTKTHAARVVALDDLTVELLTQHKEDQATRSLEMVDRKPKRDAFLFSYAPDGSAPMRPSAVSLRWYRLAHAEGIICRFHDLRHAAATLLVGEGVPLPVVSKRLGHQKVSTTADIYSHVLAGQDREAANVMGSLLAGDT